jgi:hypothetical protein
MRREGEVAAVDHTLIEVVVGKRLDDRLQLLVEIGEPGG